MKLKKIISAFAAVTMIASMSATVFAEKYANEIGFNIGNAPKVNVTVTRISDTENSDGTYNYQLKAAITDLGTIGTGEMEPADEAQSLPAVYGGIKLGAFELAVKSSKDVTLITGRGAITSSLPTTPTVKTPTLLQNKFDKGVYVQFTASQEINAGYPKTTESAPVATATDCSNAVTFKFKALPGTTLEILPSATNAGATYDYKYLSFFAYKMDDNYETKYDAAHSNVSVPVTYTGDTTYTCTAPAPVEQDIAIAATAEKTTATGCIWNVALTNAAKLDEFKVTFKATELEDAVRYIRNPEAVVAAMGGLGSLNFQVGVLTDTTTKTGIKAAFDVKDSDGKTASTGDVAAAAAE